MKPVEHVELWRREVVEAIDNLSSEIHYQMDTLRDYINDGDSDSALRLLNKLLELRTEQYQWNIIRSKLSELVEDKT